MRVTGQGDHDSRVGSDDYRILAGGSIFGPRMVPHTWQNIGIEQGKLLVLVQPAGQLEEFFMEFSELMQDQWVLPQLPNYLPNMAWRLLDRLWAAKGEQARPQQSTSAYECGCWTTGWLHGNYPETAFAEVRTKTAIDEA